MMRVQMLLCALCLVLAQADQDLTAMSAAPKKVSAQTVSYWRKLLATGLSLGGATLSEAELNDLKSKLEVAEESKPLSKPVSEPVSKTVKKAMVRSEAAPVKPHVQAKLLAVENKAKQAKKVKAKEEEEDVPKVEINGVEQPDPLYDSTDERMHSAAGSDGSVQNQETDLDQEATKAKKAEKAAAKPAKKAVAKKAVAKKDDKDPLYDSTDASTHATAAGSDGSVQNQETDLDQEATKAKKAEKAAAKPAKKAVAKKAVAKKDDKAHPADADTTAIAVDAPEPAASVDPDESERQAADHELALR